MPKSIEHLAAEILKDPARVEVTPEVVTVDKIDQRVMHVDGKRKRELLSKLLDDTDLSRVIVFTRTKHCANRVSEQLDKAGVPSEAIHGNKSQGARQRALDNFRNGKARVLVATDIAARGIDVTGITHVINYELPNEPEAYVHRIGRTARAGKSGIAVSFCDGAERAHLKSIERLTKRPLTIVDTTELLGEQIVVPAGEPVAAEAQRTRRRPPQWRWRQSQPARQAAPFRRQARWRRQAERGQSRPAQRQEGRAATEPASVGGRLKNTVRDPIRLHMKRRLWFTPEPFFLPPETDDPSSRPRLPVPVARRGLLRCRSGGAESRGRRNGE